MRRASEAAKKSTPHTHPTLSAAPNAMGISGEGDEGRSCGGIGVDATTAAATREFGGDDNADDDGEGVGVEDEWGDEGDWGMVGFRRFRLA